ncbi:MAG: serine hydrolase domain-containing protein [Terriglobia bacterium]
MRFVAAIWIVAACGSLKAAETAASEPLPVVSFDAAAAAAADLPRLHSLLVSRGGKLVFEHYYNGARATRPVNIKSASKSIISALVGIAIDRDLIAGPRQPIAPFFPNLADPLDNEGYPRKSAITIEDLLSMRSGLETTSNRNYGRWVQSGNWVRHILTRPFVSLPGTSMEYSTGNTHLLSAILTKVTGASTWQFAQESLARPLGFTLPRWPQDPQGIYFGGNDMLMTPRQMLAFGELYRNRGRANGQQVIPAEWVHQSFVPRVRSRRESDRFYGYGWWIRELAGQQTAYAWGFGGQFIFVVPKLDLVVVTTSATTLEDERRDHRFTVLDLVERFIIAPTAAAERAPASAQAHP